MKNKPNPPLREAPPDSSAYDEQRVPFDMVMRKLASTKPPHKAPKTPKPKKG